MTLFQIVKKTSHDVADCFKIQKRGYLRPGYYADLAIINRNKKTEVKRKIYYINVVGHLLKELIFLTLFKVLL